MSDDLSAALQPFGETQPSSRCDPASESAAATRQTLNEIEQILERISDAFIALDTDWRCTHINQKAAQILGRSAEDLMGRRLWTEYPQGVDLPFYHACHQAQADQTPLKIEAHYPPDDRWFETRLYPSENGLSIFFQDVTERRREQEHLRESQEHFQAIAEATPASIVISRMSDGTILYANPFARQLFGVALDADVSRYAATDFYPDPADRAETVHLLSLHPIVGPRELAVKRLDGAPIWAMGSFQRLTYKGEQAVLATHHDITERKQIELMKEQFLKEAQERADRDPLTELLNHRAFQQKLKEEADHALRTNSTLAVLMLDVDNFKFFNDVYGHIVGDDVLRLVAQRLQQACRSYAIIARFGGDEFALLIPDVGRVSAAEAESRFRADFGSLTYCPDTEATVVPVTVSVGAALYPNSRQDPYEVFRQADKRLLHAKTGGHTEAEANQVRIAAAGSVTGFSLLDALVTAVDNKDRYTRRHSEDVLIYSLMIAREIGLDEPEQRTVAIAALLHDVGKIGVPDAILRKPGRLTNEEFEAVKQHPQMGAIMVTAVPGLENTLDAVRHHHERWDGTGYPYGLRSEQIPLIARLMAVADAFSAMTTDRPYRKGLDWRRALHILEEGAGSQWDPKCVHAFIHARNLRKGKCAP